MPKLSEMLTNSEPVFSDPCPVCSVNRRMEYGDLTARVMCLCEQKKAESSEKESQLKQQRQRIERARKDAFGMRENPATFDMDDGRFDGQSGDIIKRYAKKFGEIKNNPVNGIIMYGPTRQGKTFMSECITNAVIDSGYTALFDTAAGFIQRLRSLSGRDALLTKIDKCDLLVLDDLGAESETDFVKETIFSIIDKRMHKPLIVTTNISPEDVSRTSDLYRQRIFGRILEECFPIKMESSIKNQKRVQDYKNFRTILER